MENNLVYIQKQNGNWLTENCWIANQWFTRMGYEIKPFEMSSIDLWLNQNIFPISKKDIVIGGINTLHRIIDILKVKQPGIHNPHIYLPQYCGDRNIIETTLGEFRQEFSIYGKPYFIKPLIEDKLFTGLVINNELDLLKIRIINDATKVLRSDVINIVSEYRCFVYKGKLVGAKNYTGNFKIIPNWITIDNAIQDYKEQPIAYSIDFACTDKGETLLIEINDAFGLSYYGFNPMIYCQMLKDRWKQIMQTR